MRHLIAFLVSIHFVAHSFAITADEMPDANMRKTFMTLEEHVGMHFDYTFSESVPDVALARPGKKIYVNNTIWLSYDGYQRFFWLLHEMGHHKLGHCDGAGYAAGMTQPWLQPSMELAADRYAIRMMIDSGLKIDRLRIMAQTMFANNPGDKSHPSGAVRFSKIAEILDAQ